MTSQREVFEHRDRAPARGAPELPGGDGPGARAPLRGPRRRGRRCRGAGARAARRPGARARLPRPRQARPQPRRARLAVGRGAVVVLLVRRRCVRAGGAVPVRAGQHRAPGVGRGSPPARCSRSARRSACSPGGARCATACACSRIGGGAGAATYLVGRLLGAGSLRSAGRDPVRDPGAPEPLRLLRAARACLARLRAPRRDRLAAGGRGHGAHRSRSRSSSSSCRCSPTCSCGSTARSARSIGATQAGTSFVFGYLGGAAAAVRGEAAGLLLHPRVPRAAAGAGDQRALGAVLLLARACPWIVRGFSWLLVRAMRVGGAVGLSAAANVFVGMVEAPLVVRPVRRGDEPRASCS